MKCGTFETLTGAIQKKDNMSLKNIIAFGVFKCNTAAKQTQALILAC